MKKTIVILFFITICICLIVASNKNDTIKILNKYSYSFIIQDSPATSFTMRQFNQNYLSAYRYISNQLYSNSSSKQAYFIQYFSEFIFLLPLTHEEGHRSVLTSMNIGSISRPYFNTKGAAYVNGVRDSELKRLRDSDLPNYIRLHTAGLESDYMTSRKIEELVLLGGDNKRYLDISYFVRKLSLMSYYTGSLIPNFNPKLKEETNELERDIVGHDVYGVIKNLHRPNEHFYRYTNFDDLTNEELRFLKRVGYRALINIASPVFFKKLTLINKPDTKLSIGAGYTMSPFGDFIDENIYVMLKDKYKIHAYLRQFQNKQTWFPAGGASLIDFRFSPKFSSTFTAHVWSQPENMDFNTSRSIVGGAADILLRYELLNLKAGNSISLDLGMICKTKGFLPEEVKLNEHFGLRLGFTLNLLQK
jgi:hypothetical protein